ncbi:MAG: hypothetical protein KIT54_12220 [Phycisphaeraceae bacterium]|nr:hypothetical protein [Phycisphaeraceae bacterium]
MHKTGYNEQMQALVAKYRQAGQPWPATTREIAAWLVRTNQWEPSRELAIEQCADDLARAMREEFITDRQGRRVRAKHAARREVNGEQQTFWADLRTAPREHMEIAFAQRRQQIVSDCAQLKRDVDCYNENFNTEAEIQMVFDFTMDLEELEAAHA